MQLAANSKEPCSYAGLKDGNILFLLCYFNSMNKTSEQKNSIGHHGYIKDEKVQRHGEVQREKDQEK